MAFMEHVQHLQIPLQDILLATQNFDKENFIGRGGFGRVYRGVLSRCESHITVAIKRLDHTSGQGQREFLMEIGMLSSYRHENLVSLVGFCDESGEKVLVYEYASNGSLDKFLDSKGLTWTQRLKICLDAARGLKYLHNDAGPQHRVIHRDIKSSNILLDENWKAKVSDFGLSKIGPSNLQFTFLISNACGTLGYVDPQYVETGILTKESDVFSFGVVLFEVLCGRLACIECNDQHRFLFKVARRHYKDEMLDSIIDQNLRKQMSSASLKRFSTIAYQCVKKRREKRPSMILVMKALEEALDYQVAIDGIQRSIDSEANEEEQSKKDNSAMAMASLEDEFRDILISCATSIKTELLATLSEMSEGNDDSGTRGEEDTVSGEGGESSTAISRNTNRILEINLIPSDRIIDLRCIAERMINAGYLRECVQAYVSVQKSTVVDAGLKKLGVEKLSIGDILRLEWDALNSKIGEWIRTTKVCVKVLFASEKRVCKQIFEDLGTLADECFMDIVKGPAIQLFNFGFNLGIVINTSHLSPERLFNVLDFRYALLDLLPDIAFVFDSKSAESIRVLSIEILPQLAEAARGMLLEFEKAVVRESSQVPIPDGTIHPFTKYVMDYISLISSNYKRALGELIVSKPETGSRYSDDSTIPDMDFTGHEGQLPLALHLIWIIVSLQFNLEGKSKHYKDNSIAHLFIMNNFHYIFQKINGSSELREMIGYNHLKTLKTKFMMAGISYQRATWNRVLSCLRPEGLHRKVSKSLPRERLRSFNAMFEEVHRTQALWLIPDAHLREELRISISQKLIPAYFAFLQRISNYIESERHPQRYIKYSTEDLETAVLDLFEGCAISQNSKRRWALK